MTTSTGGDSACQCYCHVNSGASCNIDAGTSGVPGIKYCGPHTEAEHTEQGGPPLLTAADAWKAVDALTRPAKRRLVRDDGKVKFAERVELPPLLDQLVDAMESGAGSKGRGRQLSKPPLDIAAMTLLIDIAEHVRSGCWNWSIKRSHDIAPDLRALTDRVLERGNPVEVHLFAAKAKDWCGRIKATISNDLDRTWRMRGKCTVCGTSTVQVWDADETVHRQPALIVHSDDGTIRKVECSFCGTTLSDDDLTTLVAAALAERAKTSDVDGMMTA